MHVRGLELGSGTDDTSRSLEDAVYKSHHEALITSFRVKEENSATSNVDIWCLLKISNVHYVSSYDFECRS